MAAALPLLFDNARSLARALGVNPVQYERSTHRQSVYLTAIIFAVVPIGYSLYVSSKPSSDPRYLLLALGSAGFVWVIMFATRAQHRPSSSLPWIATLAAVGASAALEGIVYFFHISTRPNLPHVHAVVLLFSLSWALSAGLDIFARFDGTPATGAPDA